MTVVLACFQQRGVLVPAYRGGSQLQVPCSHPRPTHLSGQAGSGRQYGTLRHAFEMIPETSLGATVQYWSIPAGVSIYLVDTSDLLQKCKVALEAAYLVGLDAEWQPGSSNPKATVLQLAVRTREGLDAVFVLDLLALAPEELQSGLQQLFRNRGILKVGYGLVVDLWATAAALGSGGSNCVAVIENSIDLGALHRQLCRRQLRGISRPPAVARGLSGLVAAQLGAPLNKALQCSAWHLRPLSAAQVRYAAADAACSLCLLDQIALLASSRSSTVAVNGSAEAADVLPPEDAGAQEPGDGTRNAECITLAQHALSSSAATEAGGPDPLAVNGSRHQSSCNSTWAGAQPATKSTGYTGSRHTSIANGSNAGTLEANMRLMAAAAERWGERLELSGSLKASRPRVRRCHISSNAPVSPAEDAEPEYGWPGYVPWQANGTEGVPRFMADVMMEGVARQLRLCGIDAAAVENQAKERRHVVYRALVERAEAEGRIILTSDRAFIRARYTDQAYFVRADNKRSQLEEILAAFSINVGEASLLSRCAKCNGLFVPTPLKAHELHPDSGVPEQIRHLHDEFWVCGDCGKVYWQGGQYDNAIAQLSQRLGGLLSPLR